MLVWKVLPEFRKVEKRENVEASQIGVNRLKLVVISKLYVVFTNISNVVKYPGVIKRGR